ncbi:MAG: hypothetical protein COB15_17040 [Flavobacteriales bacterium]|nr:MAG: hypothetical protein COB15_17040 [Flavobacteriales bacterium]
MTVSTKNDRLKFFLKDRGIRPLDFAKSIGSSQQYVSALLTNKSSLGVKFIEKLTLLYPELSDYWLITGKGEMLNETKNIMQSNKTKESPKEDKKTTIKKMQNSNYNINESTLAERFQKLLNYLGLNSRKLAMEVGDDSSAKYSYVLSGKTKSLNSDTLNKISKRYPQINLHWLNTGNEEILLSTNNVKTKNAVPYYDVDFKGGYEVFDNNESTPPNNFISHPDFNGCTAVVRHSGKSMGEIIDSGDKLGLLEVPTWVEFLAMGEIYGIITTGGQALVKVIIEGKDDDHFKLISKPKKELIENYPPQQIHKKHILKIYQLRALSHKF